MESVAIGRDAVGVEHDTGVVLHLLVMTQDLDSLVAM
jgi:hypothetical protein